jgi:hypothetical protein
LPSPGLANFEMRVSMGSSLTYTIGIFDCLSQVQKIPSRLASNMLNPAFASLLVGRVASEQIE